MDADSRREKLDLISTVVVVVLTTNLRLTARVRLEVMKGNNRQLHDLAWEQQCVGDEGHGTIR
jgi:hypothetical protein